MPSFDGPEFAGVPLRADWRRACRVATTGPVDLDTEVVNGGELDGVTLVAGMRVLVKDQADPVENGVWVVWLSGAPRRADDWRGAVPGGAAVPVQLGEVNAGSCWMTTNISTGVPCVVGSSEVEFQQLTAPGVPAGPAGGALTGEYPNPTLGPNVVDSGNFTLGAVGTTQTANNAMTNAKLADMAEATIKGRQAGAGAGDPQDLTASEARTALGLGAAATLAVGTTAGTVAAGDHDHDADYVDVAGDTMTGALTVERAAASDDALVVEVAGDTAPRLRVDANGGIKFTEGNDPDGPTFTPIGVADGWSHPVVQVTPGAPGADASALAVIAQGEGAGTDDEPYLMLYPLGLEVYMGGNSPETYGCVDIWTSSDFGTERLPHIYVYGGTATTPEPMLLVGPGDDDPMAILWNTGDVEVKGPTRGLILTSPDGSRWRVTVDDDGALVTTSLEVP